jgi:hypothetical protein
MPLITVRCCWNGAMNAWGAVGSSEAAHKIHPGDDVEMTVDFDADTISLAVGGVDSIGDFGDVAQREDIGGRVRRRLRSRG